METENGYKFKFGSLLSGVHDFQFEMTDDFFQRRSESLVKNGLVNVHLRVEKADRQLGLRIKSIGKVNKICDICLSDLDYPIDSESIMHVKLTDEEMEDEADLIHVPSNTFEIDLTDIFYDFIVLGLPMKIMCNDSNNRNECDLEAVTILNATMEDDQAPNPEWQKLKDLYKKN